MDRIGYLCEPFNLTIIPQAGLSQRGSDGILRHMCAADDNQPYAATSSLLVVGSCQVNKAGRLGIVDPTGTSRRKDHAVLEKSIAELPLGQETRVGGHSILVSNAGPAHA